MKISAAALFVLFLVSSPVSASSVVTSQAELNWSGMTLTTTGSLVIDCCLPVPEFGLASSTANTTLGGQAVQSKTFFFSSGPLDWSNTAASSSYSNSDGSAAAEASTNNGFLQSHSLATTLSASVSRNSASTSAFTLADFDLSGHGTGAFTFALPYTLLVSVVSDGSNSFRDFVSADASVLLMLGPGVVQGGFAADSLSLNQTGPLVDSLLTRSGLLTVSVERNLLAVGTSFDVSLQIQTHAVAGVPEPSTLLLLGCGVIAVLTFARCGLASS